MKKENSMPEVAFVSQSLSSAFVRILYKIIIKDSSELTLQKKMMKHDNIYAYSTVLRFVKHFE